VGNHNAWYDHQHRFFVAVILGKIVSPSEGGGHAEHFRQEFIPPLSLIAGVATEGGICAASRRSLPNYGEIETLVEVC
jgi:hypothetical protein